MNLQLYKTILCLCAQLLSSVWVFVIVAGQAPLVHGIFQKRILEWAAISFSRGFSLTQGSNPHLLRLLHRQVDSLPLHHIGLVAKSCPIICDPMDWSPPGPSVRGIFQAGILEWVAISSPGDLPKPGIEPASPTLAEGFFYHWTTREATYTQTHIQIL